MDFKFLSVPKNTYRKSNI